MVESEEKLKRLLMKVKKESAKVGLKLNIQKTKTMTSSPITSWEIYGETVETLSDFVFLGSEITADGLCSLVKAMVYPVVMYGYESWTIKKAECQRIDASALVMLEMTLESPLDCKEIQPVHLKGDQSWVFIGRTDVKLTLQYFDPLCEDLTHLKSP